MFVRKVGLFFCLCFGPASWRIDRWLLIAKVENLERVGRSRHRRCDPGRAHRLLHPRLLPVHQGYTKLNFFDPSLWSIGGAVNLNDLAPS